MPVIIYMGDRSFFKCVALGIAGFVLFKWYQTCNCRTHNQIGCQFESITSESQIHLLKKYLVKINTTKQKNEIFTLTKQLKRNYNKNSEIDVIISLLNSNCYYIPCFLVNSDEPMFLYNNLKYDFCIKNNIINDSNPNESYLMFDYFSHKYKDNISPTFTIIMDCLQKYFSIGKIIHGQINHYVDNTGHVPFHSDFYFNQINMTIGLSFGSDRVLLLRHKQKKNIVFQIPQKNGDLYAFNDKINQVFEHSIPKEENDNSSDTRKFQCGSRMSIILFCNK